MKCLVVIPARGGSKGIPHKNIKPLCGKPLIEYSIDIARIIATDDDICVSTDDPDIIQVVEEYGLKVPFVRPDSLATDTSGTNDVLMHSMTFYESAGKKYDAIVLLQPTSPFRTSKHIKEALNLYNTTLDMVVSVKETTANPYYNCFEEDENGFLHISKGNGKFERRQDVPPAWEYNGSIYIINTQSLRTNRISQFKRIKKYLMDDLYSIDIDSPLDWLIAETLLINNIIHI